MEVELLERKAQPLIALAGQIGCEEIFSELRLPDQYNLATFVDFIYKDALSPKTETVFFGVDGDKLCGPVGCGAQEIGSSLSAIGNLPGDISHLLPKMTVRSYNWVFTWGGEGVPLQWREIRARLDYTAKPLILIVSASRSVVKSYGRGKKITFKTGDLFAPDYQKRIEDPVGQDDLLQEAINNAYTKVR